MKTFLMKGPAEYVPSNSYHLYGRMMTLLAQCDSKVSSVFHEYDGLLNEFIKSTDFIDTDDFLKKARTFLFERGLYLVKQKDMQVESTKVRETVGIPYTRLEVEFRKRLVEQGLSPDLCNLPQYQVSNA